MALASGTRLGPYEIQSALGVGGMGEVYRARDTTLNRDVAVKVLPAAFTADPDRLIRFKREAQVLASVNHSGIAAIYGFEESTAVRALVLELIDGPTLADRLEKGPLAIEDALPLAFQLAEALDAAHERGVVHRDLKPANLKITTDRRIKVLDFGLAKAVTFSEGDQDAAQTENVGLTLEGVVLGTAAYMSPEQARGLSVDKRTDIWAFGCVLFEMLTARRAFGGATQSDAIAAVLERQPAWDLLPANLPPAVGRLIRRCLEKDVRRRMRDIADGRAELEEALAAPTSQTEHVGESRRPAVVKTALALVATAATAAAITWVVKPAPSSVAAEPRELTRFVITPAEPLTEPSDCRGTACEVAALLAVSRDGRRVAYVAGRLGAQRIYVREIDQFESRPVAGTEGGSSPLFSPDGKTLAFLVEQTMKKVSLDGGVPVTVYEPAQRLSTWETGNTILITGPGNGIWRVSVNDGTAKAVTTVTNEIAHRFAEVLPGGKALVFSALLGGFTEHIYVQSLETGERRSLVDGSGPHYLPTGHLVYAVAGRLMAARFDPIRLELKSAAVPVVDGIRVATSGTPQLGFADTGSLVYVPAIAGSSQTELVWVDLTGTERPTGMTGRPHAQPRISPDGRRVAVALTDSTDLWEYDLARETWSRLTFEGTNAFPLWTPDGHRLTFASRRAGPNSIYWKQADGSGPDEPLHVSNRANIPLSWSPDGRVLAFVSVDPKTGQDIWSLTIGEKAPRPFLQTPFREGAPTFSPDGGWLAYASDESGRSEIYVRPFPGPGQKWTISTDGGIEPVWPKNGHQLFYRNGDTMLAVDVTTVPAFSAGKPRRLFERHYIRSEAFWPNYDVAADGQRLLMIKQDSSARTPAQINVVLNWLEDLKRRVPAER